MFTFRLRSPTAAACFQPKMSLDRETRQQLEPFRRQYLQLLDLHLLTWPVDALLRSADVQQWLHEQMFDPETIQFLPPSRYRVRVLKELVRRIELAIMDPDEDVICPNLNCQKSPNRYTLDHTTRVY